MPATVAADRFGERSRPVGSDNMNQLCNYRRRNDPLIGCLERQVMPCSTVRLVVLAAEAVVGGRRPESATGIGDDLSTLEVCLGQDDPAPHQQRLVGSE